MDADGRDQVGDETNPVAIPSVEPKPEGAETGSAGEVREERGLAVAGFGDDEDGSIVEIVLLDAKKEGLLPLELKGAA